MRILQINNHHYIMGGAHKVYFNTAALLEEHGHEVFFFSMQDEKMLPYKYAEYFPKAINYRELSTFSKLRSTKSFIYNKQSYNKLINYIDLIKPDIAHIHLFMGGLTTSILLGLKEKKVPIVFSVHDYRLLCPAYLFLDGKNKVCEQCKDKFYIRCLVKGCSENNFAQSMMLAMDAYFRKYIINPMDYIDRFIFVSQFIREKHIEFDVEYTTKAESLYNFIPNLNSIVPSDVKGKYFLYYGRLSREKGVLSLIESAIKAKVHLKIVGSGPLLEHYKNQTFDNIEFLGYKKGEALRELVSQASFVIVPSEWYENNPLTILEAYSLGKPVIGTKIGGIPEIIEEDKTGFLYEAGNTSQLTVLLEKAYNIANDQYIRMSKNAREYAENNFNPDTHYDNLMSIYNKCINLYKK